MALIGMACALVASASAEAHSAGTITISVATDRPPTGGLFVATFGKPARLRGTVATGAAGTALVLEASPFKTAGFSEVARSKTTAGGAYTFTPKPTLATRYRVALADDPSSRSPVVSVYVGPRDIHHYGCANGPVCNLHVGDTLVYPSAVAAREGAKTMYFYVGVASGSQTTVPRVKLVATGPQHRVGSNRFRIDFSYSFPTPGPYRYSWVACTRDTERVDGFGLPGHHHCGDRTIAYPAYSLWTG
jgi:hypothetical protein